MNFLRYGLRCIALIFLYGCGPGAPVDVEDQQIAPRALPSASPADAGLHIGALDQLSAFLGGHGVVLRHGQQVYTWGDPSVPVDVASACKPVISAFLLFAVQEGLLRDVEEPIAGFEPQLKLLPGAADKQITFRDLASQRSGYGHSEAPGEAWAYNDYAMALLYDVLTGQVFGQDGTTLLIDRLARPLGFEDPVTMHSGRAGRLAISARDFAKIGLLFLQSGHWSGHRLLSEALIDLMLNDPVPAGMPRTRGEPAPMLEGQRTLGGRGEAGKDLLAEGPGHYSFNWWVNQPEGTPNPLWPALPPDTYAADGHVYRHMLWVIPAYDMVVVWQDTRIGGDVESLQQATELLRAAVDYSSTAG